LVAAFKPIHIMETVYERYWRRKQEEIAPLVNALAAKHKELDDQLRDAQLACNPHTDNGGMFEGACTKCGALLG
jgi:hypothetical protein